MPHLASVSLDHSKMVFSERFHYVYVFTSYMDVDHMQYLQQTNMSILHHVHVVTIDDGSSLRP